MSDAKEDALRILIRCKGDKKAALEICDLMQKHAEQFCNISESYLNDSQIKAMKEYIELD